MKVILFLDFVLLLEKPLPHIGEKIYDMKGFFSQSKKTNAFYEQNQILLQAESEPLLAFFCSNLSSKDIHFNMDKSSR